MQFSYQTKEFEKDIVIIIIIIGLHQPRGAWGVQQYPATHEVLSRCFADEDGGLKDEQLEKKRRRLKSSCRHGRGGGPNSIEATTEKPRITTAKWREARY